MKLFNIFTTIFFFATVSYGARTIKIIAYPYIPDLGHDGFTHLKDFLENRFHADTNRRINVLFDILTYATDTYTPPLVIDALGPSGGYDMQEIDAIILGELLDANAIKKIPNAVDFDGFAPNVLRMVTDQDGDRWGHPSYTCTNVLFSYDQSVTGNHNISAFLNWMRDHRAPGQLGWTGDLSQGLSIRLQYLDGWRDSHPDDAWYPTGYTDTLSGIDQHITDTMVELRDSCADTTAHTNHCTDQGYYFDFDLWFGDFNSGKSLTLQGFPEYTSEIIEAANVDPYNPTRLPTVASATMGEGNRPFLFVDAWVISRTNCDGDCMSTAKIFLNWQRENWAQLITLGKDLSPSRPRFLSIAFEPFYSSDDFDELPNFGKDYYSFFHQEIARARDLNTIRFWDNEETQSALIKSLVTDGYTP
jgi:hypothetical protein